MTVTSPAGLHHPGQLARDYPQQLRDYEDRRSLTLQFSTAISVANPNRNQFMVDLAKLLAAYEARY
ncbi:hypothetical protein CLV58_11918 [Spirosoma oryzae]|uniref:Uncharacterized protein n=1 Tax=Spirosoma oryzae TaxID=1469603 RepID=A0A2T0SKD6_9BACT|nr:hypothetical protein [Spirosoma oryzae]PRY33869.1 hypothetical protein CLV58_11918 [Spirosoma oryzae]